MQRMKFLSLTSFLFFVISGCTSNKPTDLEISHIGTFDENTFNQHVATSIHESWLDSKLMIVALSTSLNLVEYTNRKDYPLNLDGRFCNDPETPVKTFDFVKLASSSSINLKTLTKPHTDPIFTYYTIIPTSFSKDIEIYGRPEREDPVFYKKYDLSINPNDLCFVIGGYIYGFGFKSNTAILTKEIISKELNNQ